MAKGGLLGKLLTAAACGAAIGGACYIFRDKIKESKIYEDLKIDDKLMTLKDLLTRDSEDEEDYFDEDEYIFETGDTASDMHNTEDAGRNYVSLNTAETDHAEMQTGDADTASVADDTAVDTDSTADVNDAADADNTTDADDTAATAVDADDTTDAHGADDMTDDQADAADTDAATEDSVPTISLHTADILSEDTAAEDSTIFSDADTADAGSLETAEASTVDTTKGGTPSGYDMEGLSDVSEDPDVLMEMTKLDAAPSDL